MIGVGAVITMVTLGNGATQAVSEQIASLGSNLVIIRPAAPRNWTRSTRCGTSEASVSRQ